MGTTGSRGKGRLLPAPRRAGARGSGLPMLPPPMTPPRPKRAFRETLSGAQVPQRMGLQPVQLRQHRGHGDCPRACPLRTADESTRSSGSVGAAVSMASCGASLVAMQQAGELQLKMRGSSTGVSETYPATGSCLGSKIRVYGLELSVFKSLHASNPVKAWPKSHVRLCCTVWRCWKWN